MNLTRLELAVRDRAETLKQTVQRGTVPCSKAEQVMLRAAILIDLAECLANYEVRLVKDAENDPINDLLRDEVQL